jgi:hypothetical protein
LLRLSVARDVSTELFAALKVGREAAATISKARPYPPPIEKRRRVRKLGALIRQHRAAIFRPNPQGVAVSAVGRFGAFFGDGNERRKRPRRSRSPRPTGKPTKSDVGARRDYRC